MSGFDISETLSVCSPGFRKSFQDLLADQEYQCIHRSIYPGICKAWPRKLCSLFCFPSSEEVHCVLCWPRSVSLHVLHLHPDPVPTAQALGMRRPCLDASTTRLDYISFDFPVAEFESSRLVGINPRNFIGLTSLVCARFGSPLVSANAYTNKCSCLLGSALTPTFVQTGVCCGPAHDRPGLQAH